MLNELNHAILTYLPIGTVINILQLCYLFGFLYFLYTRTKLLIHFFQQEEYDNTRFILYIIKNPNLIDKKLSLVLTLILLVSFIKISIAFHYILISLILFKFASLQHNPCKKSKKPLVFTARVLRLIYIAMFIASFTIMCITYYIHQYPTNTKNIWFLYGASLLLVQCIPLLIIAANILLLPIEKLIQLKYLCEAKAKLAKYNPIIIGITGSYGKTSTKHILAHILTSIAPTLATPGSINTPMGITRVIREQLKPEHKFFIVEMGAYGIGSITRLCNLTPPTHGIITAIGNAHFERFKSMDNVATAKFELAKAIMQSPQKGYIIINNDTIEQRFINKYCDNSHLITVQKSIASNAATYTITNANQTLSGVNFEINCNKTLYAVITNLYGLHHVENMGLCFALAHTLGMSPETIIAALNHTPQIRHRLEVITANSKPIIIDDAYNSNPTGFTAALDVLKVFRTNGHRCIIVTPGMIELGRVHDEKHFELGVKAAAAVDYVLVVIPQRIQAFIDGFNSQANSQQTLLTFSTFGEAKAWLDTNATATDVILFENDLPDLYEAKVQL